MRELRNTRQLKSWLKAGKTIELRERDRVLGRIVPLDEQPLPEKWPNFEAYHQKIFGDRVLNAVAQLLEDGGRY